MMTFTLGCSEENPLVDLLLDKNDIISKVISEKDKYEVQIIYTRVMDKDGKKVLKTYTYNEKPKKYFYPASTVKFPAAVLTLEKLNEINISGVNKNSHISIDSTFEGHVSIAKDYRTECGYPNLADYIKQIFIVSDNESFNRLYDFLGQNEINSRLSKRGFNNTKIIHRLSVTRTSRQNMETNQIKFYDGNEELIYTQPARIESSDVSLNLSDLHKGKGFYSGGSLINEPKDFSKNNFFGLRDQHDLLIRVMLPDIFAEEERFNLNNDDYEFLREYMSKLPIQSECPIYDPTEYYDGYVKFFMFGDSKETIPDNIKIYSKSGLAYGYLTDNAYIVDTEKNIEFFISATVHVNENQIYNDDNYEYDEIGLPFLAQLGRIIYDFELNSR